MTPLVVVALHHSLQCNLVITDGTVVMMEGWIEGPYWVSSQSQQSHVVCLVIVDESVLIMKTLSPL